MNKPKYEIASLTFVDDGNGVFVSVQSDKFEEHESSRVVQMALQAALLLEDFIDMRKNDGAH